MSSVPWASNIPVTSDSTPDLGSNLVRNAWYRYDMSQPQNRTVAQVSAELNLNNIPYQKTEKTSKLFQLYKDNCVRNQKDLSKTSSGDRKLGNLAKTVADLRKSCVDFVRKR